MDSTRDTLAAKYFPAEWAAIANKVGASKKRTQLRKRAEYTEVCVGLRARGASCANCGSFKAAPSDVWFKHHCETESDFYGYVKADATGLCARWHERKMSRE